MSIFNKRAGEEIVEFLINLSGMVGLEEWTSRFATSFFNKKEIKPADIESMVGKILSKAKAEGTAKYNLIQDRLNSLQTTQSSPVLKNAIRSAIIQARKEQANMQLKLNKAEAYERANSELANEIANMNHYSRSTERAKDLKDKIEDNANKAAELYRNLDKVEEDVN